MNNPNLINKTQLISEEIVRHSVQLVKISNTTQFINIEAIVEENNKHIKTMSYLGVYGE